MIDKDVMSEHVTDAMHAKVTGLPQQYRHLSRSALLWMHFWGGTKARSLAPPALWPGAGMCGLTGTTSATGAPVW